MNNSSDFTSATGLMSLTVRVLYSDRSQLERFERVVNITQSTRRAEDLPAIDCMHNFALTTCNSVRGMVMSYEEREHEDPGNGYCCRDEVCWHVSHYLQYNQLMLLTDTNVTTDIHTISVASISDRTITAKTRRRIL